MNLKNNLKAIGRNVKRFGRNPFFRAKFLFTKYYDEGKMEENDILIHVIAEVAFHAIRSMF